jgi:hypothetical protein
MRRSGHTTPAAVLRYQHVVKDRKETIANAKGALMQANIRPIAPGKKRACCPWSAHAKWAPIIWGLNWGKLRG